MNQTLSEIIKNNFSVDEQTFIDAINDPTNAGARGSILGAISENLLKKYLINNNFSTFRIVEKPKGGFDKKNDEARGDFYIQAKNEKDDKWLVVESKGLKSNSEKHGHNFYDREKCFIWLKNKIKKKNKEEIYEKGLKAYLQSKNKWLKENPNKKFPDFAWNKNSPGSEVYNLDNLFKNETELKKWINSLPENLFKKENVDIGKGAISIIMTHMPSTRIGPITKIKSTGPLKGEFSILAVDLFFRTGKHNFIFASSDDLSHQSQSPEHLSQNYTIDILLYGIKKDPIIQFPWFENINECIKSSNLIYKKIDKSQLDERT